MRIRFVHFGRSSNPAEAASEIAAIFSPCDARMSDELSSSSANNPCARWTSLFDPGIRYRCALQVCIVAPYRGVVIERNR
jgi:hypothetical protein